MALKFAVNNSLSAVTSLPTAIPTGSMTLLQTQTASSSSSIDFTSNIDSTYDVYCFKFIDIHGSVNSARFTFQADTGTNTSYNITTTNATFRAFHTEADSSGFGYMTGNDLAQSTSFIRLSESIGNVDDESGAGELSIYNPSSNTFVKHYICRMPTSDSAIMRDNFIAGYFNTTTPLTRFRFKMSSGTFDGVIKLYGIS